MMAYPLSTTVLTVVPVVDIDQTFSCLKKKHNRRYQRDHTQLLPMRTMILAGGQMTKNNYAGKRE
jgi:hypothetical protein